MSALSPSAAMALALRLLEERGFAVSARNTRGDSVYLRVADGAHALRVSNHARTPKQRRNHPDVATSLILREPKTPAQVEALVATAVRDFFAMTAHRGQDTPER